MPELAILAIFLGCVIAIMFKQTWWLLGKLLVFGLIMLKLLIIVGILFGFLNLPSMYKLLGWTPISLIAGDEVYQQYQPKIKK